MTPCKIDKDVWLNVIFPLLEDYKVAQLATLNRNAKELVYTYFEQLAKKLIVTIHKIDAYKLSLWPCLPYLHTIHLSKLRLSLPNHTLPCHNAKSVMLQLTGKLTQLTIKLEVLDPANLYGEIGLAKKRYEYYQLVSICIYPDLFIKTCRGSWIKEPHQHACIVGDIDLSSSDEEQEEYPEPPEEPDEDYYIQLAEEDAREKEAYKRQRVLEYI
jgi:hypothetical protein